VVAEGEGLNRAAGDEQDVAWADRFAGRYGLRSWSTSNDYATSLTSSPPNASPAPPISPRIFAT
jgi:hypothetical protein